MLSPQQKNLRLLNCIYITEEEEKGWQSTETELRLLLRTSAKSLANNQSYQKTQMVTVSTTFGFLAFGLRCLGTV